MVSPLEFETDRLTKYGEVLAVVKLIERAGRLGFSYSSLPKLKPHDHESSPNLSRRAVHSFLDTKTVKSLFEWAEDV